MTISRASATWQGDLAKGTGHFSAGSGTFAGDYSAAMRFEGADGTTPEELLAAAHAACYSMALAHGLSTQGLAPTRISTTAACTIEKTEGGFSVTQMVLTVRGAVPGATAAAFAEAAEGAKTGCPVSRALAGIPRVELHATLE